MGNLIGKFGNNFKGQFTRAELISSVLIPFSQLYFRVTKLNGSLDKPWLLFPLFLVLPFSLLPTLMMHFGYVSKGNGNNVHDNWMYIPVVFYVLYNFFLNYLQSDFDILFRLGGLFVSILIPYFIREYDNCKKLGLTQFANVFSNALLVLGISYMLLPLFELLGYLPMIGIIFSLLVQLRNIPMIGEVLLWSIGYIPTYVTVNMINYAGGLEKYCGRNNQLIFSVVGVILTIGGYYLDDYLYFSNIDY